MQSTDTTAQTAGKFQFPWIAVICISGSLFFKYGFPFIKWYAELYMVGYDACAYMDAGMKKGPALTKAFTNAGISKQSLSKEPANKAALNGFVTGLTRGLATCGVKPE